ncbi:copia protein [Tanacetum coccineum]
MSLLRCMQAYGEAFLAYLFDTKFHLFKGDCGGEESGWRECGWFPVSDEPFDEDLRDRIIRHPFEAQTFPDPILYLAGLAAHGRELLVTLRYFIVMRVRSLLFRFIQEFLKLPGNQAVTFSARPTGTPVVVRSPFVNVVDPLHNDDQDEGSIGPTRSIATALEDGSSKRKQVAAVVGSSSRPEGKRRKQDAPKRGSFRGSVLPHVISGPVSKGVGKHPRVMARHLCFLMTDFDPFRRQDGLSFDELSNVYDDQVLRLAMAGNMLTNESRIMNSHMIQSYVVTLCLNGNQFLQSERRDDTRSESDKVKSMVYDAGSTLAWGNTHLGSQLCTRDMHQRRCGTMYDGKWCKDYERCGVSLTYWLLMVRDLCYGKSCGEYSRCGIEPTTAYVGSKCSRRCEIAPDKPLLNYCSLRGYDCSGIFSTITYIGGNGIDVVVWVDSIRVISEQFANTTYGFFLGKKVAYPVVANYVRNTWGKYGLLCSMFSSSTRLFSFQFSSVDRLDAILENGPWFIWNNPLILKKWHPDENLLKEDVSTGPVWVKLHGVPVTAFSEDGLSAIATKMGTPLMLDSYTSDMRMQSWGRSSYARVMIELRADVELKDNIIVAMPKITREGHYTCNVCVEYKWKPPMCSSCKVFGHIHEECPKNTCAGEKKNVKKPSQPSQGVPVDPKIGFKPQKEYRPVLKKSIASSSGNKKKGKLRLLDNDGNPLVPTGIVESDSEVEVVFDETANLRISTSGKDGSDKGYGTNSLLEQWRDSYPDNDDYDPYDDDMYENHDLSEHLQSICDDLDITVRGRKKK